MKNKTLNFIIIAICVIITVLIIAMYEYPPIYDNNYAPVNPESIIQTTKININTAVFEELTMLKGIGETKAKAIIIYREENGDFKSITELKKVKGISEKLYDEIKNKIEV